VHSLDWWRKLWERTGLVSITSAEILPQAEGIRQAYIEDYKQSKREPFKEALDKTTRTSFRSSGSLGSARRKSRRSNNLHRMT